MIKTGLFEIGKRYSFNTYSSGQLPYNIENVKIVSMLDGMTAERLGYNVATKHAQVYAGLPHDAPITKEFTSQYYYEVEYDNGNRDVFGHYWINHETIQRMTKSTVTVILADIEPDQITALRETLSANGFIIDSIKVDDVRV